MKWTRRADADRMDLFHHSGGAGEPGEADLCLHEGNPAAVAKTELLYYFEENIYCRIDYAAEPGEALAVVGEKWIFAEQFDEREIWN